MRDTADQYGVLPHIRFSTEMEESAWDEAAGLGGASGPTAGELTADVLVSAIGATAEPEEPVIDGLASFTGHRFHSARWDHGHDLRGERVGVIGTGPGAAQFVPHIQPEVARLTVFQRTAPWVLPHVDRPVPGAERALYKLIPALQDVQRNVLFGVYESMGIGFRGRTALIAPVEAIGRAHLRRQVRDPELRAKLTPHYRFGCKRPILSNTYNPALAADNAEVVTEPIVRVERGTRSSPGTACTAPGRHPHLGHRLQVQPLAAHPPPTRLRRSHAR